MQILDQTSYIGLLRSHSFHHLDQCRANVLPRIRDRVKCATEAGVTGRFLQHVGQVMSCVGHELSLPLWFGDWQGGSKDIPDVTIWKENKPKPSARVAGEMKAPWTCDLRTLMSNSDHDDSEAVEQFEEDFSAWAGKSHQGLSRPL